MYEEKKELYRSCGIEHDGLDYFPMRLKPASVSAFNYIYFNNGIKANLEFCNGAPPLKDAMFPEEHLKELNINPSSIDYQISAIYQNFSGFASNFLSNFPFVRKVEMTLSSISPKSLSILLCQLKSVQVISLVVERDMLSTFVPVLPEGDFQAKALYFCSYGSHIQDYEYLKWVSSNFKLLEELYVSFEISPEWCQTVLEIRSLKILHSFSPQSMVFWDNFLTSTSTLRLLYLNPTDPDFNLIRDKFKNVRVLEHKQFQYTSQHYSALSGYELEPSKILSLLDNDKRLIGDWADIYHEYNYGLDNN